MRVFIDTNVWLSASIFSGLCEELVLRCVEFEELFTSRLIQTEAHEVLARKFPQCSNAGELFDAIWQTATLIDDVVEPADDNDMRLVKVAAAANVNLFVTGDKRVGGWNGILPELGQMQIAAPRQAWIILFGSGAEH